MAPGGGGGVASAPPAAVAAAVAGTATARPAVMAVPATNAVKPRLRTMTETSSFPAARSGLPARAHGPGSWRRLGPARRAKGPCRASRRGSLVSMPTRTRYSDHPPRYDYALTAAGRGPIPALG